MKRVLKRNGTGFFDFVLRITIYSYIALFIFCCDKSGNIESNDAILLLNNSDYYFLDVRTIQEHKNKSIPGTNCIPVQELEQRIEELDKYRKKKIIVYCRSGNRSGMAVKILNKSGFNALNMSNGMNEWKGETIKKE